MLTPPKPMPQTVVGQQRTEGVYLERTWLEYFDAVDRIVRLLTASNLGPLIAAANDAAAAAAGVPIGGLYRVGSAVQIRVV